MAITTSTFKVNAGWGRSDIITQMESAMVSLGWMGGTITGYVVGISSIWGGGDTNVVGYYQDVRQKSTSGVGTNASFFVYRDTLGVRYVNVNRPGYGYTSGELITLDADDIGGFANGATDLSFKVCVDEVVTNGTTVSVAVTNIVYTGTGSNYTWRFSGTDRNGVIGAGQTIITIREGDTISIANSYSSSYDPIVVLSNIYEDNVANTQDRGVLAGMDLNINPGDGYSTYQFKIGQAGTYFWKSSQNNLGPEMGRLIVEPWSGNPEDRTIVGYGTTSAFWDKNLGTTYPLGIQKHPINPNKRYGNTYRGFVEYTAGSLDIVTFSDYMHYPATEYRSSTSNGSSDTRIYHGGVARQKRLCGAANLDYPGRDGQDIQNDLISFEGSDVTANYARLAQISHGTNYGFDLDLNLFKSGLDPRFVVFSWKYPTLSSTHLTSNTGSTFFFHNFETPIWDLDHVFLGGMTEIIPATGNTTNPQLIFRTYLSTQDNSVGGTKRTAEFPYQEYRGYTSSAENYAESYIVSQTYPWDKATYSTRIYYRSDDIALTYKGGYPFSSEETTANDRVSPDANFNAVIKGLPLNVNLLPCPYFLPDDFGLIEFYYNAANANIQQGDTITISPSEVWTVITASYNQTTVTRGIAFCARSV
jgi:hypothetical protein